MHSHTHSVSDRRRPVYCSCLLWWTLCPSVLTELRPTRPYTLIIHLFTCCFICEERLSILMVCSGQCVCMHIHNHFFFSLQYIQDPIVFLYLRSICISCLLIWVLVRCYSQLTPSSMQLTLSYINKHTNTGVSGWRQGLLFCPRLTEQNTHTHTHLPSGPHFLCVWESGGLRAKTCSCCMFPSEG